MTIRKTESENISDRNSDNHRVRNFFASLGPGLVTGAADDDPSGISTYSVAGASFGISLLWTALLSYPLMASVQLMCARLGMVCGEGLGATLRRHSSRKVLWFSCSLLFVANIVNIGADLAGMGDSLQLVTHVHAWIWIGVFTIGILLVIVYWSYRHLARTFKWLTMVLLAYVIAAFLSKPNWPEVLKATFVPRIEFTPTYLMTFVGILGTTISPYLFFWQAAQEVEEERAVGRTTREQRKGATKKELKSAKIDVLVGMAFSNLIMFFIILTTASTLHISGGQNIETAQQAAEALRPMAGDAAYWLFTLGIIGTGVLAIPVLSGSAAYALAEAMHWPGSLDDKPKVGRKFYAVLIVALLFGLLLNLLRVDAVQALFLAAVVNGLLAPPLVFIVTKLTSDPKVMGERVSGPWLRGLGYATAAIMAFAAVAMIVTAL